MLRSPIFLASALLLLAGLAIGIAPRQRAEAEAQAGKDKAKLSKLYFGVERCRNCHGQGKEVEPEKSLYYRGTEMSVWDSLDKHKDATTVLMGPRSQQMAKLLGYKTPLTKEPKCLNCHGVHVEQGAERDPESYGTDEQREKSGVSCVACHGPYAEWVNAHAAIIPQKGKNWKDLTPTRKQHEFGLANLWDPATRAALCCSCHVGNAAEGKMVTHEMYAAGHPPLPGIEIVAFADAMPRHWRTFTEKIAARPDFKAKFKANQSFDADREGLEQTRMLVIGAVGAFRASMRLVADQAKAASNQPPAAHQSWPELASFDCYACHHDLKKDSWRQKRGYMGKPGRPALRSWPAALLDLGTQRLDAAGRTSLHSGFALLRDTLDQQPFGDPAQVARAADMLDKWCGKTSAELTLKAFDKNACRQALEALLAIPAKRALDFDSARQIGWALPTLVSDLDPALLKNSDWDASFLVLQKSLELKLIKGQKTIVPEYLSATLTRIADYDPEQFDRLIQKLAQPLKK